MFDTGSEIKIYSTYEDGYEEVILQYYPDEIKFSESELIGLTIDEVSELKNKKQQQYIVYSNSKFNTGGLVDDEVVCVNCDWSWEKANSDKEHIYNCHKCGFDNTLFYTVFRETMTLEQIAEKHGVNMEYLKSQFEEGTKQEMDEHTKGGTNIARDIGEIIALHHLEEMPDYYDEDFEQGGEIVEDCGCESSAKKIGSYVFAKGGLAYGNSHDNGGMPMKVGSTGQNIEIEGGEGVINKRSMQMTKKVNFEGKMMTPCEVISKINEMGGGVKFDCSDLKEIIEKDGDF